jgi:uncharacterized membrane protein
MATWRDTLPALAVGLIELAGAVLITLYAARALVQAARGASVRRARLTVAEGVVMGLSLKVAAALLKTVVLRSWVQLGMFAVVLTIRLGVKALLNWEIRHLAWREGTEWGKNAKL